MAPHWIGLFAALIATPALADSAGDTAWYSIAMENGAVIGHAARQVERNADGVRIVEDQQTGIGEQGDLQPHAPLFTIQRQDPELRHSVQTLDKTGRTVAIESTLRIGPDWSRTDARIGTDTAEVARETPADKRTVTVALPPDVRFDDGEGLLPAWTPATAPALAFDNFDVDAMAVEHVTITALPGTLADVPGGLMARRESFENGALVAVAELTLDSFHRIVKVVQPSFRTNIVIRTTDRDTALRPAASYRVLPEIMTKSPYRIPPSALAGHIRYRFTFTEDVAFAVPQTGEQRVTADAGGVTVDICEECGPGLPSDSATLADALRPTVWLQSDSPKIHAIADPVGALKVSDTDKMALMVKRAWSYLGRMDFSGHYSALDTLARQAGDCTEAAVLLAALGRAIGIPTRVANGLVYSRESYHGVSNTFLPHSWTLAWTDGKWRTFDLALGNFDSTHIAFTVGDGSERSLTAASQLAGLLHWESMAEIKAAP